MRGRRPAAATAPGGGVVLNFDHNDFATKMLALKKYAETGQRDRCFA